MDNLKKNVIFKMKFKIDSVLGKCNIGSKDEFSFGTYMPLYPIALMVKVHVNHQNKHKSYLH